VIRAVLDVNVLISAFIGGADGPPRRLIYAWREGRFTLVVSPASLSELTTVLGRPLTEPAPGYSRSLGASVGDSVLLSWAVGTGRASVRSLMI
jgi:predicted nucleic acid-binding protein